MRIVLIGPTYPYRGGISHHTTLLANELDKKHTLKFISFSRQYPKFLFPGKSDKDPSTNHIKPNDVEYLIDSINPLTLLKTATAIKHFNPDLVIFPWWVTFWAFHFRFLCANVKQNTNARVTFLCHNVIEHESSWLKKQITKFVLQGSDYICTQSSTETDKAKNLLQDNFPIRTAFHPTYTSLYTTDMPQKSQSMKKLGLSGPVLLFFGFIRPYKGLDVLLKAMTHILKTQKVTLLVVGEFWKDRSIYFDMIQKYNLDQHVKIYDKYVPNEEVPNFFSAADLVVQPYKSVTGSGVSQLAYGFGIPVIATNLGTLSEIIIDGVNGRLVPSENPVALASAVTESLDPETLACLQTNAKQVKNEYSWQKLSGIICNYDTN